MLKRKKTIWKQISILLILVMTFTGMTNSMTLRTHAAENAKEISSVCLNETSVYLHLKSEKPDTYDFNINKNVKSKVTACVWFVDTIKGNSGVVTIDKKTGIVTAKKAGTAYIGCKVTLTDGTVLKPEAKVVVRNNITDVKISNLPKNRTITAGKAKNFNRTILNTEGGTKKKTQGVTRWEITEDTAGVGTAGKDGIVYPTKAGSFKIRAVTFQSKVKYSLWLQDKKANAGNITASSEWQSIRVVSSDGKAVANTKEQLDKVLAFDEFKEITLSTKKSETFVIKEGNYGTKSLIVDAPNSDVENHGIFKDITIKAIKDTTWIEYASGNIVYIKDTQSRLVIDSTAQIKQIVVDTPNAVLSLEIDGKVDKISVLQPSTINLSGNNTAVPLSVDEKAGGSKITSSVPLNLTLNADTELILEQGAEKSGIDKSAGSVEVRVTNNTKETVVITTNKTGRETIEAGKSGTSNAATSSAALSGGEGSSDPSGGMVKVTGIRISPSTMILSLPGSTTSVTGSAISASGSAISATGSAISVTGSALSAFVAVITPQNATNVIVEWKSGNPNVATIDAHGFVTPVGIGTTNIVASAGGLYANATVTVVSGSALSVSGSAISAGKLKGVGASIGTGLLEGAASYAGGQLLGWGLSSIGIDGMIPDATGAALSRMMDTLNKISSQLDQLSNQVKKMEDEIINQVKRSEYDIRASELNTLISCIMSFRGELVDFIKSPPKDKEVLDAKRNQIISHIENNLIGKEYEIYNNLVGDGKTKGLLKIWSEVVKGEHRFLSAEDSAKVQAMYDYYETVQTWLMDLTAEYYHATTNKNGYDKDVVRIVNEFNTMFTEESKYLKEPVPENVLIDKDQNIMLYTGYYYSRETEMVLVPVYVYDPHNPLGISLTMEWQPQNKRVQAPYNDTVEFRNGAVDSMCYNLNYNNWNLLSLNIFNSWKNDSKNAGTTLKKYLANSGFNLKLDYPITYCQDIEKGNPMYGMIKCILYAHNYDKNKEYDIGGTYYEPRSHKQKEAIKDKGTFVWIAYRPMNIITTDSKGIDHQEIEKYFY